MIAVNNHRKQKPVIFLAFANARVSYVKYLRNLPHEHRGIRNVLDKGKQAGLCEVVERYNVTIEDIMDVFQDKTYRDRIVIFHYGGHVDSYKLLLGNVSGGSSFAFKEGLASFLGRQKGLKLIFLNSGSTEPYALEFTQAGIPAVISTSQVISDQVATQLAICFYHGIANGLTLERAWLEAVDYIKVLNGTSNFNAMYRYSEQEKHPDHFPWNIYFKEGAEKVKEWNLPDAVNDPLFGLRNISEDIQKVLNNYRKQKPVIFLAFYNDRVDHAKYLRNLLKEHQGLRNVLDKAKQVGLCEVVERSNATIEDIMDVFKDKTYKDRIAIFHYSGHSECFKLLLETVDGSRSFAFKKGFASFFARQKGLKLIFLNGCSLQQHALELIKAGVPALIRTFQEINDQVATQLSIRFYQGIANVLPLERAWREAEDEIKIKKGPANFNAMYHYSQQEKHQDRFPWDIHFKKGVEQVKEWNLLQLSTKITQVFISYSHKDKKFVNRLASDLEKAGTSVWLDEKKIKVGESISKKVEEGISRCDFFCLMISGNSVNSNWVEREYRTALDKQLSLGKPIILPLLIQDVEPPMLLREIKYADFSRGYKTGFNDLIDAIKKH